MVMPAGMAELLAQKYNIMQQQADTQSLAARAAANLDNVRAGLLPKESVANIARTNADTALTSEQAKYFGPTALAGIDLTRANTNLARENVGLVRANIGETKARTGLLGVQTEQIGQLLPMFQLGGLGDNLGTYAGFGSTARRNPALGF